jgi:hypothetical protein
MLNDTDNKEYYDRIISDRDVDRKRTFTYERDFAWCPWRAKQIEVCFDLVQKICHPYLMISTKEKWRYDISIMHCWSDTVYSLLSDLEQRTCDHCIECGKPAESGWAYQPAICDFCLIKKKQCI